MPSIHLALLQRTLPTDEEFHDRKAGLVLAARSRLGQKIIAVSENSYLGFGGENRGND